MVDTWRDSWFEEGSRLIYIVPARVVDAILPLQVEPAPSATSRVFVGRIELITPEIRRVVENAIDQADWSGIQPYERFLDPILKRVYSGNPAKANQISENYRSTQEPNGAARCR